MRWLAGAFDEELCCWLFSISFRGTEGGGSLGVRARVWADGRAGPASRRAGSGRAGGSYDPPMPL